MKTPKRVREREQDDRGKPGAEGGSGSAAMPPPAPAKDDPTPLGDTDQHSRADA